MTDQTASAVKAYVDLVVAVTGEDREKINPCDGCQNDRHNCRFAKDGRPENHVGCEARFREKLDTVHQLEIVLLERYTGFAG